MVHFLELPTGPSIKCECAVIPYFLCWVCTVGMCHIPIQRCPHRDHTVDTCVYYQHSADNTGCTSRGHIDRKVNSVFFCSRLPSRSLSWFMYSAVARRFRRGLLPRRLFSSRTFHSCHRFCRAKKQPDIGTQDLAGINFNREKAPGGRSCCLVDFRVKFVCPRSNRSSLYVVRAKQPRL